MTAAVGNTTSTTPTTGTSSKTGSTIGQAAGMGKDDFMQLLIAQLKNQDPMKPADDTQFVTQLAQFSQLEAADKMSDTLEEIAGLQALGQAASMIGKQISAKLEDGTVVSGTVTQVHMVDSKAKVVVNGQEIDTSLITDVGTTTASTTPTTGSTTPTTGSTTPTTGSTVSATGSTTPTSSSAAPTAGTTKPTTGS